MKFETFISNLLKSVGLTPLLDKVSMEDVEIGTTEAQYFEEAIKEYTEWWVSQIDQLLAHETRGSDDYNSLMDKRFFTFREYKRLFDYVDESWYRDYPVFEFLMIPDEREKERFISKYTYSFEDYFTILQNKSEVPFSSFFFKPIGIQIPIDDFVRHGYIPGRSGSGKSELLKVIFFDILRKSSKRRDKSLVMIEPHGDLSSQVLKLRINKKNRDRIIYIDPYLVDGKTPTINPFQIKERTEQAIDIHTQELVKVFQELIANSSISTQMDALLKPCIATLLRRDGSTMKDLQDFMNDDINEGLVEIGKQSPNVNHRDFFINGFHKDTYKVTKNSIYTKIQSLLNSHTFHNLVNGKSTIDLEDAINSGKVVIFNLAQGKIGSEISSAFGKFILSYMQSMAFKRESLPESQRIPTFVLIDEFQNYVTSSLAKILAEARKYGLHMILANQTIGQGMDTAMKNLILSNTAVKMVGENSPSTLKVLAPELGVKVEDIQKMGKYHFYTKSRGRKAFPIKVSSTIAKWSPRFYLEWKEEKELRKWLAEDSGYYKNIEDPKSLSKMDPRTIRKGEKQRESLDSAKEKVLKPKSNEF